MTVPAGQPGQPAAGRWSRHLGIYLAVMVVLGMLAMVFTFMWFFAAGMASDGCHEGDTRDICTVAGQHWVMVLPIVALLSAACAAVVPAVVVARRKRQGALIWLGVPLAAGAYVLGPIVANWGRTIGLWGG